MTMSSVPQEHPDWRVLANCRDSEPAIFFESADEDSVGVDTAKGVCELCTVRNQCRDYALATEEAYGIWGGLTPRERRQYKWFHFARPAET